MSELAALSTPPAAQDPRTLALSAQDVHKSFQIGDRSIEVLHGAELRLARGERLCLMGASGVGKSTFLHIVGLQAIGDNPVAPPRYCE